MPIFSEIVFALFMTGSWIFFLIAMIRIRRALKNLPNCFTNECITTLHFVVLSIQGIFATIYSISYVIVFLIVGDLKYDETLTAKDLNLQIFANILLVI